MGAGTANIMKYVMETGGWGVNPVTGAQTVRKLVGAGLNVERTQIQTQELNNRRAVTSMRLGVKKARVVVPFELFYSGADKQFDDFLSSWMCAAWTPAGAAASWTGGFSIGTITAGVAEITGTTKAGTDITAADVGRWYKCAGASAAEVNTYYRLTEWTSATQFKLAMGNITTTGAMGNGVSLTPVAYITPGSTVKSIVFQEMQDDLTADLYKAVTGAMGNNFSLTVTPDQIVTGSFDFIGKTFASQDTTPYITGTAAAPTNDPMTANDSYTYLMVDNLAVAVVTNINFTGTNGLEDQFPVGSTTPYNIGMGISSLSGTMGLYLLDGTYWTKYNAETTFGLSIRLMDPATTGAAAGNGYAIDIPKIKITSMSETKSQTNVVQSVSWMALEQSAVGTSGGITVNMRVSRLA